MEHTKIRFKSASTSFYRELKEEVKDLTRPPVQKKAVRLMWMKFGFYSLLFIGFYAGLYHPFIQKSQLLLTINYTLFGLSGILLAFNCAHDCVHHTFSKNRKVNKVIFYFIFNLQGVNARLWYKRHLASHHLFPNVDGCDADIDDNPFIRLSAAHKHKKVHQYQHLYATLLYALYTLHWIFVKDFIYLQKKNLANLKNQHYSIGFKIELVALKLAYVGYALILPWYFGGQSFAGILAAFLVMHMIISIFFVLTLIISHLSMETQFPKVDENGFLPFDYYEHQLAVSLDYHPTSKLANWIFGGFNSHAAHHLFPNLPHTTYTLITPSIHNFAKKHQLPYQQLSIPKAIRSHYRYLNTLGNPNA